MDSLLFNSLNPHDLSVVYEWSSAATLSNLTVMADKLACPCQRDFDLDDLVWHYGSKVLHSSETCFRISVSKRRAPTQAPHSSVTK